MAKVFIGTSGYNYKHWKELFYPNELKEGEWLNYYARYFNTVELNVTFYNLPSEKAFTKWYESSPSDFKFAVKGSHLITHQKKLHDINGYYEKFRLRTDLLKKKKAVTLWQFQPNWKYNEERFKSFVALLKQNQQSNAFEFRHVSWFNESAYKILSDANYPIVLCDWPFNIISLDQKKYYDIPGKETIKVPHTADFVYIRRHGSQALYSSLYNEEEINEDVENIKNWRKQNKNIYVYYNNDANAHAIANAFELKKLLK